MIAGWEVLLEEQVQSIYYKYAKDVLKLSNLLIQFPVAMMFEEEDSPESKQEQ
jgi:hypothetical protein